MDSDYWTVHFQSGTIAEESGIDTHSWRNTKTSAKSRTDTEIERQTKIDKINKNRKKTV